MNDNVGFGNAPEIGAQLGCGFAISGLALTQFVTPGWWQNQKKDSTSDDDWQPSLESWESPRARRSSNGG